MRRTSAAGQRHEEAAIGHGRDAAGVKLTGKIGRTDVGVINVNTGDARRVSDKNLFVARLRRNFLRQSFVGAIVTEGDPSRETAREGA